VRRSTLTRAARCSRSGPARRLPTRLARPLRPDRSRPRPQARARPGPRRPAERGRRPWLCTPLRRHETPAVSAHRGILRWMPPSDIGAHHPGSPVSGVQGRPGPASPLGMRPPALVDQGLGSQQRGVQASTAGRRSVIGGHIAVLQNAKQPMSDHIHRTDTATHSATRGGHCAWPRTYLEVVLPPQRLPVRQGPEQGVHVRIAHIGQRRRRPPRRPVLVHERGPGSA